MEFSCEKPFEMRFPLLQSTTKYISGSLGHFIINNRHNGRLKAYNGQTDVCILGVPPITNSKAGPNGHFAGLR